MLQITDMTLSSRVVNSSDWPLPRGPKTGLGLGLYGNGLGLKTLWPRVVRPRGLVYCNELIAHSVANNCQFQVNVGNCYCKVSQHDNQGWQHR